MSDDRLIARILNAVPARSYEMTALLSLLRIEITTDVPTACVSCERRPVLRVNPEFVTAHCRTDEHLFLLVMHELHHVLLGHTRLFPRPTLAHNLAFDAVINAFLGARFPGQAYRSFFLDLYGDQTGAARLLAPPKGAAIANRKLAALHERLYTDGNTTAEEIFHAIVTEVGGSDEGLPMLLGSHGSSEEPSWGTEGPASKELVTAIREIVEKWPPPANPIRGRSLADVLSDQSFTIIDPTERVLQATRRALLGAATRTGTARHLEWRRVTAQVPIPVMGDRRALVARASGATPVLHQATLTARGRTTGEADVYVDVSGSMDEYIAPLYGALTRVRAHIARDVTLFSTKVVRIPLAKLSQGTSETTGGTDIACVINDVLARRAKKVLIVTDGYVGAPNAKQVTALQANGTDVRVLLTPDGWKQDLQSIAARMDELPDM